MLPADARGRPRGREDENGRAEAGDVHDDAGASGVSGGARWAGARSERRASGGREEQAARDGAHGRGGSSSEAKWGTWCLDTPGSNHYH
jgi:hypothetical protein